MEEQKENKMNKRGLKCPFMKEGEITCGEKCALFCYGLGGCVLHSINMHIKEQADRTDRTNKLLSFIEKKIENLGNKGID